MSIAGGWILGMKGKDYLFDIHPKTRGQYEYQKFVAGIIPQYGSYMTGKSQTAKGSNTMQMYGIEFSDITYPWLSGLSGGNEYTTAGSAGWQFSKNVASLYKGASHAYDKSLEEKHRRIRAELAREARERRWRHYRYSRW